jgi:hypothetical protein
VTYEPLINHLTRGEVTTNAGNAQRYGPNPSDNTGAANGEEEMIPTTEDKRADPRTHSPYVVENENRGDVAVDGFWRNGRRCIFDVVSRTQSAEQPGIWIHSRFSEDVSGSKKRNICGLVMRCGGTLRHLCIPWTAAQVKRLSRRKEIGRQAGCQVGS